jgi:hypothetical protein
MLHFYVVLPMNLENVVKLTEKETKNSDDI